MHKKILAFCLTFCFIASAHAGFEQRFLIHLAVVNKDPNFMFQVNYHRVDKPDSDHLLPATDNGQTGEQIFYSDAPQNMFISLIGLNPATKLIVMDTCVDIFKAQPSANQASTPTEGILLSSPYENLMIAVFNYSRSDVSEYYVDCNYDNNPPRLKGV